MLYHLDNQYLTFGGGKNSAENKRSSFNESFLFEENNINYPNNSLMANNSICFIISDFLYDIEIVKKFLMNLKQNNISGFLIQILEGII